MKTMKKSKTYKTELISDYAVIGTGNIALRHINNIKKNKKNSIITVCKRSNSKFNQKLIKASNNFTNNINMIKPKTSKSIAIISSPASYHIDDSIVMAKNGFHLLIEKPMATDKNKTKNLISLCKKNKLKTLIGYNLRFLDNIIRLKKIIKDKKYGKIHHVHIYVGSNYKTWRDNNYLHSVSHSKKLGGGVVNELSHEIDYMIYLFNQPDKIMAFTHKEDKNNAVEKKVICLFEYKKLNFHITMHLNMISDKNNRYCLIETDKFSIKLDLVKNKLLLSDNKSSIKKNKINDMNQTYVDELNHLHKCINSNKETKCNLVNGIPTLNTILAIKKSLKNKMKVKI